jgi:thiamine kinase-like enzyme
MFERLKKWRFLVILTLIFFSPVALELPTLAESLKNKREEKEEKPMESPVVKFNQELGEVEKLITQLAEKKEARKLLKELKKRVKVIKELDKGIRAEFKEIEEKLKLAKLPKKILHRHYKVVKEYEKKLKELLSRLENVKIKKSFWDWLFFRPAKLNKKGIKKALEFIEQNKPPRRGTRH